MLHELGLSIPVCIFHGCKKATNILTKHLEGVVNPFRNSVEGHMGGKDAQANEKKKQPYILQQWEGYPFSKPL